MGSVIVTSDGVFKSVGVTPRFTELSESCLLMAWEIVNCASAQLITGVSMFSVPQAAITVSCGLKPAERASWMTCFEMRLWSVKSAHATSRVCIAILLLKVSVVKPNLNRYELLCESVGPVWFDVGYAPQDFEGRNFLFRLLREGVVSKSLFWVCCNC